MASCQQYDIRRCGDCKCGQRPQPLPQGQIVRVTCKAYDNLALGIDNGIAKLVMSNPNDLTQKWVKVEKVSSPVPVFLLWNEGKVIACPDDPGEKVKLVDYNPLEEPERIRWSHAEFKDALDFTPIFNAENNNAENILNFDVNESTLEVVVQKPNANQSQLWHISTVSAV